MYMFLGLWVDKTYSRQATAWISCVGYWACGVRVYDKTKMARSWSGVVLGSLLMLERMLEKK